MKWFPPCFAFLATTVIFVLFACSGDDSIPEENYYDNGTPVSSSVYTPDDSSPPSSSSRPGDSLSSSDGGYSSSDTSSSSTGDGGGTSSSSDGAVACAGTQLTATGINTGSASSGAEFNYCCTGNFQIAYYGGTTISKNIIVTGGQGNSCSYTGATNNGTTDTTPGDASYKSICSSTGPLTLKADGNTWSNMYVRCIQ